MKKHILLAAAMTLMLGAGCAKPAAATTPEPAPAASATPESVPELQDDIYIFYTSDVHCGVGDNLGLPALKAMVDENRAEHAYTFLVDCGDFLQGGTLGSMSRGSTIISLMNQMGYDAVAFGNHEFDYGMDRLKELLTQREFDMVIANGKYTGSGTSVFEGIPPYVIRDCDSTKIAFVGVLTPETLTTSTPTYFMENGEFVYNFYTANNGDDLAAQVQKTVDDARAEGAAYVILLSHLGSDTANTPYDSISLIHKTTGIDAVIDGHSHSIIIGDAYPNAEGEDVLLTSVGTKMQNVGELIIGKDGTINSLLISEYDHADPDMETAIAAAEEELNAILAQPVGTAEYDRCGRHPHDPQPRNKPRQLLCRCGPVHHEYRCSHHQRRRPAAQSGSG